jgi:hypothetical protein
MKGAEGERNEEGFLRGVPVPFFQLLDDASRASLQETRDGDARRIHAGSSFARRARLGALRRRKRRQSMLELRTVKERFGGSSGAVSFRRFEMKVFFRKNEEDPDMVEMWTKGKGATYLRAVIHVDFFEEAGFDFSFVNEDDWVEADLTQTPLSDS